MSITQLTPTSLGGLRLARVADMAPHINMLIYGEPGVGKTRLCASADAIPTMRKVLLLDVDGGALSAKGLYPDVEVLRVTRWKQLIDIHQELAIGQSHGFQTVIMDTGTEAQKYNMSDVMAAACKAAEAKGEVRDPDVPSLREWGITQEQFRRLVRGYRDLPLNFIMTCHVKDDRDDKTGITKKSPDLPGKLTRQIAGFFDIVLYMYILEVDVPGSDQKREMRLLMSSATHRITAKDRTDKLPRVVTTPTMQFMHNAITGTPEPKTIEGTVTSE